jgi:hypothetical protein
MLTFLMLILEVQWGEISGWAYGLVSTGILGGAAGLGYKAYSRFKTLAADNKNWKDYVSDVVQVGKEYMAEGQDLAGQLMALSKAVKDKDSALARVSGNAKMREEVLKLAASENFPPEVREALAGLMTPVAAGIRYYAGIDTDKLAALKAAMESEVSKQEAHNKIMANSGKFASLIGKVLIKVGPGIVLSGGKVDPGALVQAGTEVLMDASKKE